MSTRRPARKQATRRPAARQGRGRLLGFGVGLGLAVGLFVALLVYLADQPAPTVVYRDAPPYAGPEAPAPEPAPEPEPAPAPAQPATVEKPEYEFYTILPKMEVYVPEPERALETEPAAPKAPAAGRDVAPVQETGTYLLQVGSFRQHQQADRLKASLALLGVESSIQTVRIDDGSTWHRVQVGPYQDLDRLNRVRAQLRENDIPAMLLKLQS